MGPSPFANEHTSRGGGGGNWVRPPPRALRPETALARLGVRAFVCVDVRRVLRHYLAIVMFPLCMSVCPGLCSDDEEQAKSRALSFWGIESLSDSDVDTSAPRGRTLDGGTTRSLGIKVPRGDSSRESRGRPMGPSTPLCYPQSFLVFCYGSDVSEHVLLSAFCSGLCFGKICSLL